LSGQQISVDHCPHIYDWSMERYLRNWYSNYSNGHLLIPLFNTPAWITEAINLIGFCQRKLEEERKK
jgi:hypothetical protein